MGNSLSMINPAHVRIYQNIIKINNPHTRVQMIETVLNGQEFVSSAKHAGVYPHLLSYITYYRRGVQPPVLPGEPGYNPGSSFVSGADARQDPGIYTQQTPGTATHPSLMNRPHQPQQSQ
jgi:hypothetical protein